MTHRAFVPKAYVFCENEIRETMAEQIREVVKRGRWFYDETVPAEVRIIRQNFADPPHPGDEDVPEGEDVPPPYGPDGFCYYAVFEMTGRGGMTTRSGTGHYSSIDEVIRRVERTLNGKVTWDET
jgi:hypothetical protein